MSALKKQREARAIAYEMLSDAAASLSAASGWAIIAHDDGLHALANEVARELEKVCQTERGTSA